MGNSVKQISLITPWLPSAIDHIKICALYFDSIRIRKRVLLAVEPQDQNADAFFDAREPGVVRAVLPLLDDELQDAISLLHREQLVEIIENNPSAKQTARFLTKISKQTGQSNPISNFPLFREVQTPGANEEKYLDVTEPAVGQLHAKYVGPISSVGDLLRTDFLDAYYSGLLLDVLESFEQNTPVITGSNIIYDFINSICASTPQLQKSIVSGKVAFDAISVSLIDVRHMTFEDILEARYHLRNELEAFRAALNHLQFDFLHEFGAEKIIKNGSEIAQHRILPVIEALESQLKTAKFAVFKNLLKVLKKPDPYVPLIGSSFVGIPIEIGVLLSLGLVSGEVALDWLNDRRGVADNGLYYLLRLRQEFKKKASKLSKNAKMDKKPPPLKECPTKLIYAWPEFLVAHENDQE